MIRLQIVISYADFCVLNADENCQMRWQKKENKPKGQPAHTQAALNERKADGKM
jgi:hypothetical protein